MNKEISEGIILNADFGYGMKFNDKNNLYLKLEIQDFNGYPTIQLFNLEQIPIVLEQFKSEIQSTVSVESLVHRKVYLLHKNKIKGNPNAITGLNPYEREPLWIYNNNWD